MLYLPCHFIAEVYFLVFCIGSYPGRVVGGGGGGTALCMLYIYIGYVPHQRVWVTSHFGLKYHIYFYHFGLKWSMVFALWSAIMNNI